eukprot:m.113843 g.113843  ORF g.113843 m.113843 type:complete len:108 (+) comp28301_c0_seq2:248-571(+)
MYECECVYVRVFVCSRSLCRYTLSDCRTQIKRTNTQAYPRAKYMYVTNKDIHIQAGNNRLVIVSSVVFVSSSVGFRAWVLLFLLVGVVRLAHRSVLQSGKGNHLVVP